MHLSESRLWARRVEEGVWKSLVKPPSCKAVPSIILRVHLGSSLGPRPCHAQSNDGTVPPTLSLGVRGPTPTISPPAPHRLLGAYSTKILVWSLTTPTSLRQMIIFQVSFI